VYKQMYMYIVYKYGRIYIHAYIITARHLSELAQLLHLSNLYMPTLTLLDCILGTCTMFKKQLNYCKQH